MSSLAPMKCGYAVCVVKWSECICFNKVGPLLWGLLLLLWDILFGRGVERLSFILAGVHSLFFVQAFLKNWGDGSCLKGRGDRVGGGGACSGNGWCWCVMCSFVFLVKKIARCVGCVRVVGVWWLV